MLRRYIDGLVLCFFYTLFAVAVMMLQWRKAGNRST
jgi:hypothetical protein